MILLIRLSLPKRKKSLPVFVEEAAMDNLLDEYSFGDGFAGIRDRSIIEMLYLTGMRRAELIGLHDTDVDLAEGYGKGNRQAEQAEDHT